MLDETAATGFTNGSYTGITMTSTDGSGSAATYDFTVAGGILTEVSVNAAGTSVSYYINGVLTTNSPDTANIPVGVDLTFAYRINKTAGTNARVVTGDNFYLITNP